MPALVLFRRRWQIATDDFLIPATLGALVRLVWGVVIGYYYIHFDKEFSCKEDLALKTYVVGILALYGIFVLNNILVLVISTRGTILEVKKRHSIIPLLYFHTFLTVCEVSWVSYGTYLVYSDPLDCSGQFHSVVNTIQVIIISNWILIGIILIFLFFAYDSVGGGITDSASEVRWKLQNRNHYEKLWERRCRFLCCYVGSRGKDSNAYAEIARVMADMFLPVDVVPTDVAAGFVLVRARQKAEELRHISRTDPSQTGKTLYFQRTSRSKSMDMSSASLDSQFLMDLAHFVKYAIGSYGWVLFSRMHFLTSLCRYKLCGCACFKTSQDTLVGDNCFRCNYAALKLQTGLKDDDILFSTFENEIFKSPYYIALDHDKKRVVIAIRGTLSLEDCISDAVAEPEPFGVPGMTENVFAHRGMARNARKIFLEIQHKKILAEVLRPGTQYQDYQILVVGHSLGAGVATLLTILLRFEYDSAQCYAYSPPGAILTLNACKFIKSFVTSIVIGKDVVPRLSVYSLHKLRDDMVDAIANCKRSKWEIISGGFLCFHRDTDFFYGRGEQRSSESMMLLENYKQSRMIEREPAVRLYCGGKVVHIVKLYSDKRLFMTESKIYQGVWAMNEEFQEILVSPLMFLDHLPDNVLHVLEEVADSLRKESLNPGKRPNPTPGKTPITSPVTSYPFKDASPEETLPMNVSYGSSGSDTVEQPGPSSRIHPGV
eukprot:Sdes_comp9908_c0_seq1m1449